MSTCTYICLCDVWRILLIINIFWSLSFCSLVFDWFNSVIGVHQERERAKKRLSLDERIHSSKRTWKAVHRNCNCFRIQTSRLLILKTEILYVYRRILCSEKIKQKKNIAIPIITFLIHDGNTFVDWSDKQNWICRPRSLMWSCWNRFTQMWQCWIITTRIHTLGMLTSSFNCLMPTERKWKRERGTEKEHQL